MQKRLIRWTSMFLVLVLLVNMLPVSAFAATTDTGSESVSNSQEAPVEANVVAELPEKRDEYTKAFRLSNGLHMATVYGMPVHYDNNGRWADIDNTLKTSGSGSNAVLTNTAGVWDVRFPQQLSASQAVTITKDGYTLSFFMSGQLQDRPSSGQISTEEITNFDTFAVGGETFSIQAASTAAAQVQEIDLTEEKAQAQYPETISDTLHSRLQYADIYSNTDIVYDLVSSQVKESIVIGAYDASLRGYRYTLNVGKMVPVLTEENEILLYDEKGENVIMVMPAPYLEDASGEYSEDVTVALVGKGDTYVLAYTLPQEWMADKSRTYPVILDPIVSAENTLANIEDASVFEKNPEAYTRSILNIGRREQNGKIRAFVKYNALPELSDADLIIDATFNLYHDACGTTAIYIGAHKVKETWTDSTITWENQPEHDPIMQDYIYAEANEDGDYYWDVTEIVRGWYEGENTGLLLRATDKIENKTNTTNYRHQFYAENYSKYHRPSLTITYRSVIGIEPYYTYATLSAGNAGGVYISDGTGQITATRTVASYASTVNPFSASLIYNSVHFAKNNAPEELPELTLGLSMDFGAGWTLDAIQKIDTQLIGETTYLKYWDGDGTIHYFKKSSGVYYDEDGLGLEIVANSDGSYTMSDAMDNQWFFTSLGGDTTGCFLTASEDNNGNRYEMNYTNGRLTTIQQKNKDQAAITVATFTYNGNRVIRITDAAGNYQSLSYTGDKLAYISHNTTTVAQYTYDGYRLTSLKDMQRNYTLEMGYYAETNESTGTKEGRVAYYLEKAGSNTGVRSDIHYYGFSQTVYHDYGNDREAGNADDLYTHYMFDYAGRTVNAYTTDVTGTNILGANTAVYTDNDGISKQNNRTLRTASIGVAAQKLLTQGGFESTSDKWTFSGASAAKTKPRTGLYSMKGVMSSATAEAYATRTSMTLTSGTIYTLSAYVNTASVTSATGTGVYMKVTESNGTVHTSEAVDYITSSSIDKGWVRIALTFTASANGTTTIGIHGTGVVGTFYVDDVQLEKGEAPSNYNMLENGNFQVGNTATYWTLDESASLHTGIGVGLDRTAIDASAQSMKFQNAIENKYAIAYQSININKSGAQTYVVSGWAMANAVPDNLTVRSDPAYDHTKQFGIRTTVTYTDESKDYFYTPFNADVTGWQFASLTVIPASTTKTVSFITVSCVYETNANIAYFDNLSVVEEVVNSVTYNTNGKPTSSSTTGLNKQSVTYDSNGNVKTVVQKTGTGSSDKITTTYTYDSTFVHRMVSSSNGVTTQTLTHDGVGNVQSTTLSGKSGKKVASSTAYSADGNRTSSVTDSAGNTTSYAYSSNLYKMMGQASAVTDAKGTETTYTLDEFGRVTNMDVANLAELGYIYDNGMLQSLNRTAGSSQQSYQFAYDSFGNTTAISIPGSSGVTLASYNYGGNNGLLTSQSYGNGDSVSFTYDNLGRVKTTTYSDGRILTYRYTGDGQLYSVHDSETGLTYQYSYDSLGRLMSSSVKDNTGNILTTRQTYDANDQMTAQSWQMGSSTYSETYTYSKTTGLLESHIMAIGQTTNLQYDELQRLIKADTGTLDRNYAYRDISSTNTTAQVSDYWYTTANGGSTIFNYSYTYDSLGNISTFDNNGTTYTYTYDAQNQLLRQTGGDKTYTYTYDAVGNILTSSDGTVSHSYTYGHAAWKDLLTAFDGQTISYDASGNPTSYYNGNRWTMEWEEGRRLSSATNGTTNLSFIYDSEGLRLSKTVNGTEHSYYYAGDKLLRETWNGNTLDFFYDNQGIPYALKHNGTLYYYITNLQGDVLCLITGSGTAVATYSYDPYGKVLLAFGSMASINPLRYRGYYYDTDSGLYYLQSRYYDPELGRFINADSYASTGQGIIGHNMFAYCGNNPIVRLDADGQAFETVWDIISLGLSIADVIANPADIWVWISLGGDFLDVLIPFVGGIGEATKALRITLKIADGFGNLSKAGEFGIKSYKALRNQLKGTGLQAHHIIEQRLVKHLGIDVGEMLSVAVTSAEHQKFTNAWRKFFKYGMNYKDLKAEDIWEVAKEVYKDYPELLKAARKTLFG